MAYVNKSSLRTEFDAIKSQFDARSAAGKVCLELGTLFGALLMLFELMVSVLLEKATLKDSKNSSLPSSQVNKDETSTQPGWQGKGLEQNADRFSHSRRMIETAALAELNQRHRKKTLATPPQATV